MTLDSVIGGALGGAASGVIVAWVNHLLSRKQFVSERWWERRAEAYANIMEHLARLQMAVLDCIEELEDSDPEEEAWNEHVAQWKRAGETLGVLAHQETFLVSSKACRCLEELHKASSLLDEIEENNPVPSLKSFATTLSKGIEDVARCAHEDLEVGRH